MSIETTDKIEGSGRAELPSQSRVAFKSQLDNITHCTERRHLQVEYHCTRVSIYIFVVGAQNIPEI
jgi:hypothetical protein